MRYQDAIKLADSFRDRGFSANVTAMSETGTGRQQYVVRYSCDGCSPLSINGIACHETGCHNTAYRYECPDCSAPFYSKVKGLRGVICDACHEADTLNPNQ